MPLPACLNEIVNALRRSGLTLLKTALATAQHENSRFPSTTFPFTNGRSQHTFSPSPKLATTNGRFPSTTFAIQNDRFQPTHPLLPKPQLTSPRSTSNALAKAKAPGSGLALTGPSAKRAKFVGQIDAFTSRHTQLALEIHGSESKNTILLPTTTACVIVCAICFKKTIFKSSFSLPSPPSSK